MSQEKFEPCRRFAEAIEAREAPDGLLAPEFRIENVATAVTDQTYHGYDGFRQWRQDLFEAFSDDSRFEYDVVASTADYDVAKVRIVGEGAGSRVPVDLRWAAVFRTRSGCITRVAGYATVAEALEAVGLSE